MSLSVARSSAPEFGGRGRCRRGTPPCSAPVLVGGK